MSTNPHDAQDVLFPIWRQLAHSLVVARQTMHTRLNENEPELAVAVLAVALEVLAHGDGLLDELVQVLGDVGGHAW